MLKLMLKLIRKEGRDFHVPALPRLGDNGRGYVSAGAGVVVAVVVTVSLLTWLDDVNKPIIHAIDNLDRTVPGMLEQVDGEVATMLGVDKESVLRNVREGLVEAGSGIRQLGKPPEVTADRSASGSSAAPPLATLPTPNTATPEEPSTTTNESPPTTEAPPPATEAPPRTTSEPASPPPVTDTPPPATEEPSPPPATEAPPPTTEEPAPPTTEEPPATEAPPPATDPPPPATDQPPPPPTGV